MKLVDCIACYGRGRLTAESRDCLACGGTGEVAIDPPDLDELIAEHGDLEGVFEDLLKVSDDWKELRP
jgi:RecJ-like exonuclease